MTIRCAPPPPLTEPASRPRTKKRCSEKKTATGTAIETKAVAVRISQLSPREPSRSLSLMVSTIWSGCLPRKTKAIRKSFHTQRNWKIAKLASAGTESGRMMPTKIWKCVAPSMRALSIMSRGSEAM